MMEIFNNLNFLSQISCFILVFLRIFTSMFFIPIFNDKLFSLTSKIIYALILSGLIVPFTYNPYISLLDEKFILILFNQILIGSIIGFHFFCILSISSFMGEVLSSQIGLSFANSINLNNHLFQPILSKFFNLLLLLVFLFMNGHIIGLFILMNSFFYFPLLNKIILKNFIFIFLKFFKINFFYSINLILPFVIIFILLNLLLGFLNKFIPQISFITIGFSLNIIIMLYILNHSIFFIINFIKIFLNKYYYLIFDILK
ncbi:flagellar biosynthetic protein FliR [Buchnera aphidicola]|uniref:flagellar biosynthetic protein FliR n=1 Tax=Buchnera aphidicola TaxID=9 RepID=UPI0030ECA452